MQRSPNNVNRYGRAAWLSRVLMTALLLAVNLWPVGAQPAIPEFKLKAIFLFRFTQYVDWPASALDGDDRPFVIGIVGNDPFGSFLDEAVQGESVKGRAVQVRRFQSLDEITKCNMLFVGASAAPRIQQVLARVKGRPILTVSDIPDFAQEGGMIRFIKSGTRVRFRINVEAAKHAHLTISAKLLQMAEIVSTTK